MTRVLVVVAAALLLASPNAHALPASCAGMLQGEPRLAIGNADGSFYTVAASATTTLFGGAECACDANEVNLELALTQALPAGTAGIAEVWVGDGSCLNFAARTSASQQGCEKVATVPIQDLTVGSSNGDALVHVPLPARALFSPFKHVCGAATSARNGVYLFVYTDPANPLATCNLPLTESSQPPPAPVDVNVERQADGSVLVRWTPADDPFARVAAYDVLCATDGFASVAGSAASADFSECTPAGVSRRALPRRDGGILVGRTAPSGGDPLSPPRGDAVCAHVVAAASSTAIHGLPANENLRFTVVAADAYGNAAAAPVVALAPGVTPHGGCSVGGRASVTPWALILVAAALTLLVGRRRAR